MTHRVRAVIFASANVKASTLLTGKHTRAMKNPSGVTATSRASLRNLDEGPFERSEGTKPVATLIKPPLKWAGGKRWLLPSLAPLWSPHASRRYVEPFCGGLACPLGLRPRNALLNDINPHLINFYTELQRGLDVTIPNEKRRGELLPASESFQRFNREAKMAGRGSGAAFLLFKSHLVLMVFAALTKAVSSTCRLAGTLRSITSPISGSIPGSDEGVDVYQQRHRIAAARPRRILFMPTHLTMSSSRHIARAALTGMIRFALPNGLRRTVGRWFYRIRRLLELSGYIESWDLSSVCLMGPGELAAMEIVRRRERFWP